MVSVSEDVKRSDSTRGCRNINGIFGSCFSVVIALTLGLTAISNAQMPAGPDEVEVPNEFVSGTPAKAGEVNENFDVLVDAINDLNMEIRRLQNSLTLAASLQGEIYADDDAFKVSSASVSYEPKLDSIIFTMDAMANAGSVKPIPAGGVDGAPVLGYVFLTSLAPGDVGFQGVTDDNAIVALAVTSHPDFDDTPLWDEDNNDAYDDDGVIYHSHWVVLVNDDRAKAGLAVLENTDAALLPPTSPPMPMYLDSPGFAVIENGNSISVIVPFDRVQRNKTFGVDAAVTAFMQVDAADGSPLLKVEKIYTNLALSGDAIAGTAPDHALPVPANTTEMMNNQTALDAEESFNINDTTVKYVADIDSLVFSMELNAAAATKISTDDTAGTPVLGYVFPTTLSPDYVGFEGLAGVLALAVTSHPAFDDTPLWDENIDDDYLNDGETYHVHWVILVGDAASGGGFSVVTVDPTDEAQGLPSTAPAGMETLALDSPGFHAFVTGASNDIIRVIVPAQRVDDHTDFEFDGVTAVMAVDATSTPSILRVNGVRHFGADLTNDHTIDEVADLSGL